MKFGETIAPDFVEIIDRISRGRFAVRTNGAHESLRDKCLHNRCKQERFDVHIEQARDAAHGVVRVQRAEDKVTGHRRANGDVRRFDIANFSDHDDVRILSQNVAQTFGKRQIDFRFHIDLRNARQPIFHRFFDRDDAALHRIDAAEKTIERSRFAGTGRAGHENDAVWLGEQRFHDPRLILTQIEPIESKRILLIAAEQTQTDRFAVHGRNGRNAHIDVLLVACKLMRPSCGKRRSAMSMCAITFKREMIADCSKRNCGGTATSCRMPSMR